MNDGGIIYPIKMKDIIMGDVDAPDRWTGNDAGIPDADLPW